MSIILAYLRVSTDEQGESGAGLAAQRTAILAEIARRGWDPENVYWVEEVISTKVAYRPRLQEALAVLADGEADVLVVAKLDRICRSMLEYATFYGNAQKEGWTLLALNCPADATPYGKAMGGMLAVFSELERDLIVERTCDALAEKRAQGIRLGRPPQLSSAIRLRIVTELGAGASLGAIARELNDEGVPTAQGGQRWYRSTVRAAAAVAA